MHYYDQAKDLINKQEYKKALIILNKYYKTTDDLEILFHFGKVHYYLKNYKLSYKYLLKSKNISNTILANYSKYYIANILVYKKKFTKALDILIKLKECKADINLDLIYKSLLKQFSIDYQKYNFHKKHLLVIQIFIKYIVTIQNSPSDIYNIFFEEFKKAIQMLGKKYYDKKLYKKLSDLYFKLYVFSKKYELNVSNKLLLNFFKILINIQENNLKLSTQKSVKKAINIYEKYKNLLPSIGDEEVKTSFIKISFENIVRLVQINNLLSKYKVVEKIYNKYLYLQPIDDFLGNKFLNEYEIATKKVFLKSKPRRYLIAVSNTCDLKCIMCFQNKDKRKQYSLCQNFFNIFCNNLKYAERIVWQGGEPIIFPFFPSLLRECQKYPRIHNVVVSNFQNVKEELFELIVNSHLDLTISIDGAHKETYEKIRVGASFDKLIKNIQKLHDTANKFNKNLFLNINFVIIKENYKEMIDIFNFAIKYKFRQVSFIGGHVNDPEKDLSDTEKDIVKKQFNEIKKLAKKHNIVIDNRLYFPPKSIIEKEEDSLNCPKNKNQIKYIANNVPINIAEYKKLIKLNTKTIKFSEIYNTKQKLEKEVKQLDCSNTEKEKQSISLDFLNRNKEDKYITNNNLIDVKEYTKIIKTDTNSINFNEIYNTKQKIEQEVTNKLNFKDNNAIKEEVYKRLELELKQNIKQKQVKNIFCHLPWQELTVQYDNLILPHCICNVGEKIELTKIEDIFDIWDSEIMINYRLKMLYNDISLCSGQCLIQHIVRNIEYHKPVTNV